MKEPALIRKVEQQTPFLVDVRIRMDPTSGNLVPKVTLEMFETAALTPLIRIQDEDGWMAFRSPVIAAGTYRLKIEGSTHLIENDNCVIVVQLAEEIGPVRFDEKSGPNHARFTLETDDVLSPPVVYTSTDVDVIVISAVRLATMPDEERFVYAGKTIRYRFDEDRQQFILVITKSPPAQIDYQARDLISVKDRKFSLLVPRTGHYLKQVILDSSSLQLLGNLNVPQNIEFKGNRLSLLLPGVVEPPSDHDPAYEFTVTDNGLQVTAILGGEISNVKVESADDRQVILYSILPPLCHLEYSYRKSFGSKGLGNQDFSLPVSVNTGPAGGPLVADYGNNAIKVFDTVGNWHRTIGGYGTTGGKLHGPTDVAMGPDNLIYVCDQNNNRISVFTADGGYRRSFGNYGRDPGQFASPQGVAVSSDGTVYVTDLVHRIQVFDTKGRYLKTIGQQGIKRGALNVPMGISVCDDGSVAVADSGNDRIQLFDSKGHVIRNITTVQGYGRLRQPCDVACDGDILWITDTRANKIVAVDAYDRAVFITGGGGVQAGRYNEPTGLARAGLWLFVVDKYNNRIQLYRKKKEINKK